MESREGAEPPQELPQVGQEPSQPGNPTQVEYKSHTPAQAMPNTTIAWPMKRGRSDRRGGNTHTKGQPGIKEMIEKDKKNNARKENKVKE